MILTKRDYVEEILRNCRTLCFCKTTSEEDEQLKKLIAFNLQKIGELANSKEQQKWARIEAKSKTSKAKELCERLIQLTGLSQKDFAARFNVHESQVSRWLNGAEMQVETFVRLSAELKKLENNP